MQNATVWITEMEIALFHSCGDKKSKIKTVTLISGGGIFFSWFAHGCLCCILTWEKVRTRDCKLYGVFSKKDMDPTVTRKGC